MYLVLPGDALLHDFQQVVISVPAMDHQRLLHGHSQTQLALKHLPREATLNIILQINQDIFLTTSQCQRLYLLLFGGFSGVFVGVVQADLTKRHNFWMPHGHQHTAFMDT